MKDNASRPVIVLAADLRDAATALVSPSVRTVVVTPRNMRYAGRGYSAAAVVATERARAHPCFDNMLASTVPSILA